MSDRRNDISWQIYPSVYAGSGRDPNAHLGAPSPDAETDALFCAQCNAPIEDGGAISKCWFCESDNYRGQRFST